MVNFLVEMHGKVMSDIGTTSCSVGKLLLLQPIAILSSDVSRSR